MSSSESSYTWDDWYDRHNPNSEKNRRAHTNDPVNHPDHYTSDPSGVECIQITRHRNFNIGNAIKYLWRAGLKGRATHIEDLKKAVWYIEDEIKRLQQDTQA